MSRGSILAACLLTRDTEAVGVCESEVELRRALGILGPEIAGVGRGGYDVVSTTWPECASVTRSARSRGSCVSYIYRSFVPASGFFCLSVHLPNLTICRFFFYYFEFATCTRRTSSIETYILDARTHIYSIPSPSRQPSKVCLIYPVAAVLGMVEADRRSVVRRRNPQELEANARRGSSCPHNLTLLSNTQRKTRQPPGLGRKRDSIHKCTPQWQKKLIRHQASAPAVPELVPTETPSDSVHTVPPDFASPPPPDSTPRSKSRKGSGGGDALGCGAANVGVLLAVGAVLGFRAWGLYERGVLGWREIGIGAGILGGVGAVEAAVGR